MIKITELLLIPEEELIFTASRSSGPGGQNVNKVSTRITLMFDVDRSPSLSSDQKALVRERLASRINKDGILQIVSQKTRSQAQNRELALERFSALLQQSLITAPMRKECRISHGTKERWLKEKKYKSLKKQERRMKKEIVYKEEI